MLAHTRVLVADDDPLMLVSVAEVLAQMGAEVVRAESGAEVIQHLAEDTKHFALIVTDISMPWMNGVQAMLAVRNAGLATPVIVMTALNDERIPSQVQALGPNAVLLRKPFDLSELESLASRFLAPSPPNVEQPESRVAQRRLVER